MPPEKPIPFEGVLNCWNDQHDLPDLLLAVSRSGKTGRLNFSNAEADKTLYVKSGKVVFAESSSDDDALGQYLLRTAKISLQDYTRVSKLVGPGKRFGALLVAEGVLEPKELVPAVVGQVRAIIQGLFRRTETWYGFKEEEPTRKEAITLDMPIAQIILDGVQQVESWRRISKGIGELDSVYALTASAEAEWKSLKLAPAVTELLSMLREPISVAEICTDARLTDFDACRYLWAFRVLGWIEAAAAREEEDASAGASTGVPDEEKAPLSLREDDEVPSKETTMAAVLAADLVEATPSAPPRAIPQRLVETQIATPKQKAAAGQEKPSQPPIAATLDQATTAPSPKPIPESLVHTQVAAGGGPKSLRKGKTPANQVVTVPSVATPRDVAEEPAHTQMFVAPPTGAAPESPSAGEMMEAILDEEAAAPAANTPARTATNASTRFFADSSALSQKTPPTPPSRSAANAPSAKDSTRVFEDASALASTVPPGDLRAPAPPARASNAATQLFADKTAIGSEGQPPRSEPPPNVEPPNAATQFFADKTALTPPASAAPSKAAETPPTPANDSTQVFAETSAFGSEAPFEPEVEGPTPVESGEGSSFEVGTDEDFFKTEMSGEFAALSLDYGAPPLLDSPAAAAMPAAPTDEPPESLTPATEAEPHTPHTDDAPFNAFEHMAFAEAPFDPAPSPEAVSEDMPLVEATVVEAAAADPAVPVIEGDLVSPEPEPPSLTAPASTPSGMEMFAVTDPFLAPNVPDTPHFHNDANPLRFNEEEVGAALPRRASRTDDLDMDLDGLGHVFGNDD